MKRIFCLATILLGVLPLMANIPVLDSLYAELERHPQGDIERVNLLISICSREHKSKPQLNKVHAEEALEIADRIQYRRGICQATRYVSLYYRSVGDYELATEYAYNLLKMAEDINFEKTVGSAHQLLGLLSESKEDFEEARDHYLKALTIYRKTSTPARVAYAYNSLGSLNLNSQRFDSALSYFLKAKSIREEINDEEGLGHSYLNIAQVYLRQGRHQEALEGFTKARSVLEKVDDRFQVAVTYEGLGSTLMRLGQYQKAESFFENTITIARELHEKKILQTCFEQLADLKKEQSDFEAALVYYTLSAAYKDSVMTEERNKKIADIEARYGNDNKDERIELLERDNRISILWTRGLTASLILVFGIFVTVYALQKQNEARNKNILNVEIDQLTTQTRELTEKFHNILTQGDESQIDSQDQRLLKRVIEIVEHNISDSNLSVEGMAKDLGMSRSNLHRKIKLITGFPPNELIRSIRLRRAAIMLLRNADSISQISIAVGFDDHSYFSKSFKRQFGMSPSAYQESVGHIHPAE